MASIRKLESGRYQLRWYDHEGTQRCESFQRRRDAERAGNRYEVEAQQIRAGLRPSPTAQRTFAEIVERWRIDKANKASIVTDESFLKVHLLEAFAHLPLSEVANHISDYKERKAHLSRNTVNHHLTLVISLLHHAKKLKWISEVPDIEKH